MEPVDATDKGRMIVVEQCRHDDGIGTFHCGGIPNVFNQLLVAMLSVLSVLSVLELLLLLVVVVVVVGEPVAIACSSSTTTISASVGGSIRLTIVFLS